MCDMFWSHVSCFLGPEQFPVPGPECFPRYALSLDFHFSSCAQGWIRDEDLYHLNYGYDLGCRYLLLFWKLSCPRTSRHSAAASWSTQLCGAASVAREASAAPAGSPRRSNMKKVEFHLVSTSWISFWAGFSRCSWTLCSFYTKKQLSQLLCRYLQVVALLLCLFFTSKFKLWTKQGRLCSLRSSAQATIFAASSVMRQWSLFLRPHSSVRSSSSFLRFLAADWGNLVTPNRTGDPLSSSFISVMTGDPKEGVHIHRCPHVCRQAAATVFCSFLFGFFIFCLHLDSQSSSCGRDKCWVKLVNKGFKAFNLHHRQSCTIISTKASSSSAGRPLNQKMWISLHTYFLKGVIVVLNVLHF